MAEADPDVAALYGLDPAEFVAARNDLVRRLRSAGRNDDATRVAKLRRPVPAAWALNQVAREQPEVIAAALAEGARLRQALDRAVGGNAGDVRAAQAAERDAVAAAVGAARSRLEAAGHADVTPRVANTLRAAV